MGTTEESANEIDLINRSSDTEVSRGERVALVGIDEAGHRERDDRRHAEGEDHQHQGHHQ